MLCTHKTTILCQFGLIFVISLLTHISINSQPFLVGIVSVIKSEGFTAFRIVQIRVCRGIWGGWITRGSVSGCLLGGRVCVMSINSPSGGRGGSGGGFVLFELLDGHITQEFVYVGRKKDGARRPSGVGLPVGGEEVGFLGVMVETLGGLLRLVV